MVRLGGLELPTFWFVAVRTTLPNLARGLANRTLSPSFIVIRGIFAAVFCNLRYIFVTADSRTLVPPSFGISFFRTGMGRYVLWASPS